MHLAKRAWDDAEVPRVLDLLSEHGGEPILRGFEWDYIWRLCHSALLTLKGHTEGVRSVAFSPDGKRLASASEDKTVRVWEAQTGQETLPLKGHTEPVSVERAAPVPAMPGEAVVPTAPSYPHVEKLAGQPARLERHPRIRVAQVVMDYLAHGWSAEEMCRQHPYLRPAEAHAALAYYFDHQDEIDAEIQAELQEVAKARRASSPSPLFLRLRNQGKW